MRNALRTFLLAPALSAVLAACSVLPEAPAPDVDCVLGVPHAAEVIQADSWNSPADQLIAWAFEQDRAWMCPTESQREAG